MKQIKICPNTILLIILMILIVGVFIKYKYEFFNIKLEKKVKNYADYRNFINGANHKLPRHDKSIRKFPYKINNKCFVNKYLNCMNENSTLSHKEKIKICEDNSFNKCLLY